MNYTQNYRLRNQYNQIDFLIAGLSMDFLKKRHIPEKWSIHENLAHLGRYQEVFISRIETILQEEQPVLQRYRAEDDPSFAGWLERDLWVIIEKTRKDRKTIADRLTRLTEQQLKRKAKHPRLGFMDIGEWTEFFLLHENHHFYAIFRLVRS